MRMIESSLLFDRFSISLRWLILLGLSISLVAQDGIALPLQITIIVFTLWNLALTVATFLNQRLSSLRLLIVLLDLIAANMFFYFSGGLEGRLSWVGLLPLFSAAIYFDRRGIAWGILFAEVSLGIQAILFGTPMSGLIFVVVTAVLYLVVGFLTSYLSQRMFAAVKRDQHGQQEHDQDREQIEKKRRRGIYELVSTLSATLNYQRVLDTALDLSAIGLTSVETPSDKLVSAVLLYRDDRPGELEVSSARRFTPADMRTVLTGTSGLLGRSIDTGDSCLSKDIAEDPELSRLVALRACRSVYVVPLRNGLDTYGVLLFSHPDADYFDPERCEVLDIIGNQVRIALQNARLYNDLQLEKERVTKIYEETRNKLARELHDGPTQSVAALAMRTNFVRRLMERDIEAAAAELFKIEDLARRTTKEIRHMLFTLRPLVLESQGLTVALDSLAHNMKETFNQEIILEADEQIVPKLELKKQAIIFAIAEEAINNARKHARATYIRVRFVEVEPDLALLEIEDDGVGFDVRDVEASYSERGSLGMVSMQERTKLLNGSFKVDSAQGKGTRVQVFLPLSEEAGDRLRRAL
jgi:signal transduction histidine kinase